MSKPLTSAHEQLNMNYYVHLQYHPLSETSPSYLKASCEPERHVKKGINHIWCISIQGRKLDQTVRDQCKLGK